MSRSTIPPDDVPQPDAEPTAAEKAQARAFGELLEKALAGRTPPAMAADDRDLLEVATIIRAVTHPSSPDAELSASRTGVVVEGALRQAVGGRQAPSVSDPNIVALGARPRRASRTPWVIATVSTVVAAAAVVMLVVGIPGRGPTAAPPTPAAAAAQVPAHWRSRPADDLIGAIPRDQNGNASGRIDAIFADRLDGFRERTLAGRTARDRSPR
jgi:hypothetical protein